MARQQKGVALITVMLVVALASILATQMTARLQLQMQRTTNVNFNQQAYWYAMAAEAYGKRAILLINDDEPDVTHLGQAWAQGEVSYPVDFGQITAEVVDLQACFNLNALRTPPSSQNANNGGNSGNNKSPAHEAFEKLITDLNVEGVGQFEAEYMADALADWLDDNSSIVSAGGAEDNDYAAKEFPYLPANNLLGSVNELRIVEHFTVPVINALKEHVCVIPGEPTLALNINTVDAEKAVVLQALLDIPLSDVQQALSSREEEGFQSVDDFFNLPEISKAKLDDDKKKQFVVDSEYFKLKTTTKFNNSYFALNSIMKVDNNNQVQVISRTIGRD
ncbi:type II secretion system minor pseudopilin GspK [Thalassomonas actiniarum]|uniref:Type II secretion system protein K n=1 Tax=Thalassomonas actiniarum TaxID=485447 RepID=A0AAE9YPJ1_9GAMM|nr:type II secretion system minor pseudopilin GspK [Thalassomonas actiniarum]WDD98884.1 type II secretion system minor pseudopilin GspK [Thalassomonas actiniarum]